MTHNYTLSGWPDLETLYSELLKNPKSKVNNIPVPDNLNREKFKSLILKAITKEKNKGMIDDIIYQLENF